MAALILKIYTRLKYLHTYIQYIQLIIKLCTSVGPVSSGGHFGPETSSQFIWEVECVEVRSHLLSHKEGWGAEVGGWGAEVGGWGRW